MASVSREYTPIRTSSFSANRVRRGFAADFVLNLCQPARVLPCSFIWSVLNSSDRKGASSSESRELRQLPSVHRRNWRLLFFNLHQLWLIGARDPLVKLLLNA